MEENKPFTNKWLWRDRRERDRFQVELNNDERSLFVDMQLYLEQSKDATALKQWAFYGWLKKSNPTKAERYFRDTLLKNDRNNKRLGVVPEIEINDKFQRKKEKFGGNL
jgi:hypothetical protein